jgi:UDPglucose 6-dehydrogenase
MRQLYAPFNRIQERTFVMSCRSAEFTKYAANAMLATRISLMNELANLAGTVGADIEHVRQGIGSDPRIGYGFLYAGTGYGGSCFPKDLQALTRTAGAHGRSMKILAAVAAVNQAQQRVLVDKVIARFGADLTGRTFAMWGLAFKPNTDDMRNAPSRVVIRGLLEAGATIMAHDPAAQVEARRALAIDFADAPALLERFDSAQQPMDALPGADALVIVTEWKAYRSPDWAALKAAMKAPVIFDGRNLFEPAMLRAQGFEYHAVGRPDQTGPPQLAQSGLARSPTAIPTRPQS